MKKLILTGILALGTAFAQAGAPAPAGPKVPAPKSKAEAEAVQALAKAQGNPDEVIAAADSLVTKFADTDYKEIALFMEGDAYNKKHDWIKAEIYFGQAMQADPKDFRAPLMLGEVIVQHTGADDLDKEEKLSKAEKDLNTALESLKTAPKPNPQLTDAQWNDYKNQFVGEAHDDLGLAAMDRKKYDMAITEFRAASDADPAEPAHQTRLASALQQAGKNDEAITVCDKILADANLNPVIKQVVTGIKAQATAAKGGK